MPKRMIDSLFLSERQVAELMESIAYASYSGYLFNRLITLNLEQCRVTSGERFQAIQKFLSCLRRTAKRQGGEFAAIWVRENSRFIGEHVHILAYLSPELSRVYKLRYRKWLKSSNIEFVTGGFNTTQVRQSCESGLTQFERQAANVENLQFYLLKGASREAANKYWLSLRSHSGHIIGKRCGATRNLGPSARRRNGKP